MRKNERYIFAYVHLGEYFDNRKPGENFTVFNTSFCWTSRARVNSGLRILAYELEACGNLVSSQSVGAVF